MSPGTVVLVTGAARGIGAATARTLAERGATLSLVGLEPEALASLAEELGPQHVWFEADVRDQQAVDDAVAGTVERLGGIDVVMANAGISDAGTVMTVEPEAFDRTVDINLTGVFRVLRAALPHVVERRGYVLVVASVASFTPLPGAVAYAASKAGVDALAATLRLEVAHLGVRVGTAHPSWIDTDMVRDAEREHPGFRRMRAGMPWPVKATTDVETCARAMADGVEKRRRRVYIPGSIRLLKLLRGLPLAEIAQLRSARTAVPEMEDDVRRLQRRKAAPLPDR